MGAQLPLPLLQMDSDTQPRCQIDQAVVDDYEAALRAGDQFPPVEAFYDGSDYWVADGFHRIEAARQAGMDSIDALIHEGSQRDAILYSAGANARHGLRRTHADKRHVILKLLRDPEWSQWSDREIARRCAVDDKTVAKYRAELSAEIPHMRTRTVIRQGTRYQMDISNRKPNLPKTAPDFLREWVDLGHIGIKDALQLNEALSGAPPEVVEVVARWNVTDPHSIPTLVRIHNNGTGPDSTFEEVRCSGMIQPGDEAEAVSITSGQHALEQALARKHQLHRQLAAEAKEANLRHALQTLPETAFNSLLLNLAVLDSAMGMDFPGLPASLRDLLPPDLAADAALFLCISNSLLADGMAVAQGWGFTYQRCSALLWTPRQRGGETPKYECDALLLHFTRGKCPPAGWLHSTILQPSDTNDDQLSRTISTMIQKAYSGCRLLVISAVDRPAGHNKGQE